MLKPGQKTKAEMDQNRIIVALEQIMRELHAINENLGVVVKAMGGSPTNAAGLIDAPPNGPVSRAKRSGT